MITLYDFPRSSSSYRVRIALNLKGLTYERRLIDFRHHEQHSAEFLAINAQGLVPVLEIDGHRFSQSLAIIDYLETTRPAPRLLPADPRIRCEVMSMALAIACDIHPLNNLRVLDYIRTTFGERDEAVVAWYSHWIRTGLDALERRAAAISSEPFLLGDSPALLEVFLIPQLYNARRYGVDLEPYPTLRRLDANAMTLAAFAGAAPEVTT